MSQTYEDQLVTTLANNESIVHILPLDEFWKEAEQIREKAKTAASLVAPSNDLVTIGKLLSEFGMKTDQVLLRRYKGKQYIIFKGYAGQRRIFRGTRYLPTNPKTVRMAIGPKGVLKSAKGGFVLTAVLSVGIEIFDYFIRDTATLSTLLGTVTGDLIKIGLSSIAAAVAGLAVGSAAVIGTVAAAPLIAAVVVGVATGILLDRIDRNRGATAALIAGYEQIGINLSKTANEFNRHWRWLETNPRYIKCLFMPCGGF